MIVKSETRYEARMLLNPKDNCLTGEWIDVADEHGEPIICDTYEEAYTQALEHVADAQKEGLYIVVHNVTAIFPNR